MVRAETCTQENPPTRLQTDSTWNRDVQTIVNSTLTPEAESLCSAVRKTLEASSTECPCGSHIRHWHSNCSSRSRYIRSNAVTWTDSDIPFDIRASLKTELPLPTPCQSSDVFASQLIARCLRAIQENQTEGTAETESSPNHYRVDFGHALSRLLLWKEDDFSIRTVEPSKQYLSDLTLLSGFLTLLTKKTDGQILRSVTLEGTGRSSGGHVTSGTECGQSEGPVACALEGSDGKEETSSSSSSETSSDDSCSDSASNGGRDCSAPSRISQAEDDSGEKPAVSTSPRRLSGKEVGPYFYIGGGNGGRLVEDMLVKMGWLRIHDKNREDFKLKWVETKNHINYYCFKEGEQLVNRIPNNAILTTKIGLLNSLREYERVMAKVKKGRYTRHLKMGDFFPESFRLDVRDDREAFFNTYQEGETWICKPTGMNRGRGIFFISSQEEVSSLQERLEVMTQNSKRARLPYKGPMARVIQRYVNKPLLLDGKKFDIRVYMLIACTNPYVVMYHPGYARLCTQDYSADDLNITAHLTNQWIQKKDPNYEEVKDETVWSMEHLNDYINDTCADDKGLPQDWVFNGLTRRMKDIMLHCFHSVRHKIQCRLGYFDLYGFDFLLDEDMKVYLLEINVNPALHTNCEVLQDMIPPLVEETVRVSLETFEKSRKNQSILPLTSMKNFQVIYNGDPTLHMPKIPPARGAEAPIPRSQFTPRKTKSAAPPRRRPVTKPSGDGSAPENSSTDPKATTTAPNSVKNTQPTTTAPNSVKNTQPTSTKSAASSATQDTTSKTTAPDGRRSTFKPGILKFAASPPPKGSALPKVPPTGVKTRYTTVNKTVLLAPGSKAASATVKPVGVSTQTTEVAQNNAEGGFEISEKGEG
ncbi:protein polyglycylase TTLL10-like isoform X2 [Branchiostoma lanceolatum]|uniref:protein polyglycylase TTLL10-like isoform X2 n=1 Tax=Branchiostoma lanceolatum TaxID=7740 RepID=UPI0034547493